MDISGKVTISGAVNVDGSAAIGVDPGDATADAGDILAPKTAYLADGKKATGTIPTRTSSDISDIGGDVTIPEGYYASPVHVDLSGYAPLASPAFTGEPTAPTPAAGDDSTKIATTAFVQAAQVDASKASDVYLEFYGADDPDTTDPSDANREINIVFHSSSREHSVYCMVQQVNGPVLFLRYSGADYEQMEDYTSRWIHHFTQVIDGKQYDLTLFAPAIPWNAFTPYWGSLTVTEFAGLASPAFAGTPTAPTAASGTNTTQLATTAFVSSAIGDRIFIVEYGAMNPTSDYDKIAAAIASGFAVLCRFRLDTSTPVYYYAPLTEKRTLTGKEWYFFESILNNNQTSGWSNIFGAALLQRRILRKIDNTCSWALETVALPCPDAPTGNGNYKLRLMKTRNGTTYSWVSDT